MSMKLSEAGKYLLYKLEGYSVKPYLDSAGYYTIGIGHLILPKNDINLISIFGSDYIDKLFRKRDPEHLTLTGVIGLLNRDLKVFEAALNRLIPYSIPQNHFDALF